MEKDILAEVEEEMSRAEETDTETETKLETDLDTETKLENDENKVKIIYFQ